MRTLYTRIVLIFVLIAFVSGIVGVLLTSLYYQTKLTTDNERKSMEIADGVRSLYEDNPELDLGAYLSRIAMLGFQIYAVWEKTPETAAAYGAPFKHGTLSPGQVESVLQGNVYHGMAQENRRLKLFAFFENSVENTVGVPVQTKDGAAALFIRPDLERQIGEIRIIIAVLLSCTFVVSLALIVVLTRYIVKPIKSLTGATQQIVQGNFDVNLDSSRKDELGELALHFSQMAGSIRQVDRMRQEFVANVSHEIQSPLTSIQGFARAMRNKEATPEETEQYLSIIDEESGRLSSLGKQLLTLAALDKDDKPLQRAEFRLDEQIRQILIMLEWQWTEKELVLEVDLPELTIAADAHLLYEVWLNLIVNGIKFSETGGTLGVRATASKERIEVEIRDTGAGISEAELPRIFERFHKADKSRDRSSQGSGLGLAIVDKIVSLHRGTIRVDSTLGEGTTFTVVLPRLSSTGENSFAIHD